MFEDINADIILKYDFDSVIPDDSLSCWLVDSRYFKEAKAFEMNGDLDGMRAAAFFGSLCSLSFNPSSDEIFGCQWQWDGNRSATCSDFAGVASILETLTRSINHPALLARVSDVLWELNRDHKAARIALESYLDCIFMDCTALQGRSLDRITEKNIERAIQISNALDRKREKPPIKALNEVLDLAIEQSYTIASKADFLRLVEMSVKYNIGDLNSNVKKCEKLALRFGNDPHWSQRFWDAATDLHHRLKSDGDKNRCALNAAYCSISIADKLPETGNSLAVSHHLEEAIMRLRRVPQTATVRGNLKKRLLVVQEQMTDEMSVFKSEGVNLSEIVSEIEEAVAELSFINSLKEFALISDGISKSSIEEQAKEISRSSIFLSMVSTSLTDRKGRTIAKYPFSDPFDNEELSGYQLNNIVRFHWEFDYRARIEPIRLSTFVRYNPTKEDFYPLLHYSPFVPKDRVVTLSRGFEAYFKADFTSAINILVPQIEHCLREYLGLCGLQVSKLLDDGTQEDVAISKLFENNVEAIENILGENLAFEFYLLFLKRGAGKIRHSIAHGEFGDGDFWDPKIGYACWLIFKMIFVTAYPNWSRIADIYEKV